MKQRIKNLTSKVLSDHFFLLKEYIFDYIKDDLKEERHTREVYDHGDGASVLLYNLNKRTVVLTRQFRLPTHLNGTESGMSIEVCAGSLDGDNPEECAKREVLEETGYLVPDVERVLEAYASPAVMTELAYLFIAAYTDEMKITVGGGLKEEQEHIEVLEMSFEKAFEMLRTGEIRDARTIMLLQHFKITKLM
ncbi:NUDIX domain-containing protein [Aquimarina sp. RZ0]|uniref:NUDIX domain-containing protein n=1 Tax=Aquimarina sp. RZ0 TaxID=2607730 RepID=UPI0011F3D975|nr:NUDIX domain-containing protein [Aquimarina sp. RZ0]KAA1244795.1 NUDIX domain-containing protein [Aquimarina sp. RZ0]